MHRQTWIADAQQLQFLDVHGGDWTGYFVC
jgi:hypothetical protein